MSYSTLTDEALDLLVAEKIMGMVPCQHWFLQSPYAGYWGTGKCGHAACYPLVAGPPHYGREISAAWQVIEKLADRFHCQVSAAACREPGTVEQVEVAGVMYPAPRQTPLWACWFTAIPRDQTPLRQRPSFKAEHVSPARAICESALLAFDQASDIARADDHARMAASIVVFTERQTLCEVATQRSLEGCHSRTARFHDGSWWAYDAEHDSDTGPFSTEEEAREFWARPLSQYLEPDPSARISLCGRPAEHGDIWPQPSVAPPESQERRALRVEAYRLVSRMQNEPNRRFPWYETLREREAIAREGLRAARLDEVERTLALADAGHNYVLHLHERRVALLALAPNGVKQA